MRTDQARLHADNDKLIVTGVKTKGSRGFAILYYYNKEAAVPCDAHAYFPQIFRQRSPI